jgi:hypothetical protein
MEGRYPTRAWAPDEIVADVHRITLDADVSPGTYRLQAGMYLWPSLERLPVWDREGIEQPDRTMRLQAVDVR